jgi:3-(3-hydroxy-phenyl)propionate hydroxylase
VLDIWAFVGAGAIAEEGLTWTTARTFVRDRDSPSSCAAGRRTGCYTYDHERHAAARENLEVTGATIRFLVPQSDDERRVRREALEAAVRGPAAMAGVDSGRFAEPYWYVDSPLTKPEPARPFTGRPERGSEASPGPGVIVPDAPVRIPGRPGVRRLREVVRDGLTLLLCGVADPPGRARRGRPARVRTGVRDRRRTPGVRPRLRSSR